jgi:ATP-dependent RNA helicase RhlB
MTALAIVCFAALAGASGFAISFACEDFAHYIMDIEQYIDQKIGREAVTSDLLIEPKPPLKMERRHRPNMPKSGKPGGNRNQNRNKNRHRSNRR